MTGPRAPCQWVRDALWAINVDMFNVDKWICFLLCKRRFLWLGNVSELLLLSLFGNVDKWWAR